MNIELSQHEISELTELISDHEAAIAETDRVVSDGELFSVLNRADRIYDRILSLKVTTLEIGREKAGYLLNRIEDDYPEKHQLRRFLESMI